MRARWYDASTSRFSSRDPPSRIAGAIPQSAFEYSAAPINRYDPSGLCDQSDSDPTDVSGTPCNGGNVTTGFPSSTPSSGPASRQPGSATPRSGPDFVATDGAFASTGRSVVVPVPKGWTVSPARGNGVIVSDPVTGRNFRVMAPNTRYPDGYLRMQNEYGNYLDRFGRVVDDPEFTHISLLEIDGSPVQIPGFGGFTVP
jgi:hypothetical protein